MKRLCVLAGLVLFMSQTDAVWAKSLEDVLKEKSVISEEDYKEVVKSGSKYTPGKGFSFTSPDGKFSTTIGGFMQLRYTFMDLDDANNTAAKAAQDSSKPELKRVKLVFDGNVYSKDLTYNLTLNFTNIANGTTSNGGLLENAWANYKLRNELQVRVGQDKVDFGRQWLTQSTAMQFVDQSHVTAAFTPSYDTGVRIHGKIADGLLNYSITGTGGVGQNTFRTTTDNAFSARITVNPLGEMKNTESDVEYSAKPLLSIGSNFYRNTIAKTAATTFETNNLGYAKANTGWFGINSAAQTFRTSEAIDFNMFGADAAFKWKGFFITGEYMFGEAEGQSSKYKVIAQGFYAQAGYFIVPKTVELAYRYAYLDPNRNANNDLWIENSVAASWYINEHNLKLQADYTSIHKQAAIASTSGSNPTDDNQARIQLQLLF